MALLKFNKGAVASLSAKDISEGNIYITTDSQEMYVDVTGDKRIKISDFVTVSSTADLTTVEIYDNAFYYVADIKTIVKYNGVDENGDRVWIGINNTDQIVNLDNRLDSAEEDITILNTANQNTNKRIDELGADDIATTDGITVTTAVGNYTVGSTIDPNTSLQDLVLNMLCKDSKPTITETSLSLTGSLTYLEVGTSGTVNVTAKYDDGNYQYGYATLSDGSIDTTQDEDDGKEKAEATVNNGSTGANLTYLDVNYNSTVFNSQTSGNTLTVSVPSGVKTAKASMNIGAKCQHTAGYIPVSILKNKYKNIGIKANSNLTTSIEGFRWYVPMYHGFKYGDALIADPANISAAEVKGLATKIKDSTAYSATKPTSATATGSWRQYFVAIPNSYNAGLKSIIDSNNLPLTIQKANNVTLTFGSGDDSVDIVYEVFYVNLDAAYDTKKITLGW